MICEKCGSELDDDTAFCTECGAPVEARPQDAQRENPPSQAPAGQQAPNAKPPRNKLAIPLAIAAVIVVALIIVLVVVLFNQGDKDESSTNAPSSASTAASTPAPTIETELFRITLPEDIASKVSFTETHNTITMGYGDSGTLLAMIFPAGETLAGEAALDHYTLGEVYIAGHYEEARMSLALLDADNKTAHAASTGQLELGIQKLLGMTPEEFAACIALNTGSVYEPATAVFTGGWSANASSMKGESSPTEPFWGIWTDASKDRAEVEAIAQRIHDQTGDKVTVVLTTDWSNLNSEPWYVISMGRWSSEADAKAALPRIQANGYPDAYVKYSGDKVK